MPDAARTDDRESEKKSTGTQLLDRSLSILNYLGEVGELGAKPAEVARDLSITQSTAHRILSALMRHGFVERSEVTKRYRLGLALFMLGTRAADTVGMREYCRPSLLRLAAETGDVVFLMARSGFQIVCVDRQVAGDYSVFSLTKYIGGSLPLGVGCASDPILAMLPPLELQAVIEANAEQYLPYGGLTAEEVASRVEKARALGYGLDEGRFVEGISGIAVPIRVHAVDLSASLAINMTSARLGPDRIPQLLELLRREAAEIEAAALGASHRNHVD